MIVDGVPVQGNMPAVSGILSGGLLAAVVIISLLAHELAHIAFVRAFGGRVSGLKLSIAGAAAWVRGLEKLKFWQRCAIYLAGPATNALIALGTWVTARFLLGCNAVPELLQNIVLYNVVLCVFNLLPVFPLDGGRLVQLFLGNRMGVLRANRLLLKAAPVIGGVLVALGLLQAVLYPWNITLLCAGVYIRRKNKQLPVTLYWECLRALQGKNKSLPVKKIILPKSTPVKRAVEYLGWDYWAEIQISGQTISEHELMEHFM